MSKSNKFGGQNSAVEESAAPEVEAVSQAAPEVSLGLNVYSVSIPKCLLGERFIVAEDEQSAYLAYKKLGGVNGHDSQQIVKAVPKGSRDYAEAVAAYNAQLAKEAERKAAEDAAAALKPDAE